MRLQVLYYLCESHVPIFHVLNNYFAVSSNEMYSIDMEVRIVLYEIVLYCSVYPYSSDDVIIILRDIRIIIWCGLGNWMIDS